MYGMWVSGVEDKPDGASAMEEVDCRLWETGFKKREGGGNVFTLSHGEGSLHDKVAETDAARARNVRHLVESARRIDVARRAGKTCWVHCHMGKNRGPAGAVAYLLLYTDVPSLAAAFRLLKKHREKARRQNNTFARELAEICAKAGKPLE